MTAVANLAVKAGTQPACLPCLYLMLKLVEVDSVQINMP
jgi:hypothetical protein